MLSHLYSSTIFFPLQWQLLNTHTHTLVWITSCSLYLREVRPTHTYTGLCLFNFSKQMFWPHQKGATPPGTRSKWKLNEHTLLFLFHEQSSWKRCVISFQTIYGRFDLGQNDRKEDIKVIFIWLDTALDTLREHCIYSCMCPCHRSRREWLEQVH